MSQGRILKNDKRWANGIIKFPSKASKKKVTGMHTCHKQNPLLNLRFFLDSPDFPTFPSAFWKQSAPDSPNHLGNQSPRSLDDKGELVKYHESDSDTLYFHFGLLQLGTCFSAFCQSDGCETEDIIFCFVIFTKTCLFLKLEKPQGSHVAFFVSQWR